MPGTVFANKNLRQQNKTIIIVLAHLAMFVRRFCRHVPTENDTVVNMKFYLCACVFDSVMCLPKFERASNWRQKTEIDLNRNHHHTRRFRRERELVVGRRKKKKK
jgi:hypothetical protein